MMTVMASNIATWAAIAGPTIAGVALLITTWWVGRREHRQWLRNARLEAYFACRKITEVVSGTTPVDDQDLEDFLAAVAKVRLLGPVSVANVAWDLGKVCIDLRTAEPGDVDASLAYRSAALKFDVAAARALGIRDGFRKKHLKAHLS